jgi:hypothetical protein
MAAYNQAAPDHHVPWFITPPGETDALFVVTIVVTTGAALGLGVLFFRLHSMPERLSHKKLQFEIVAVLGLLSLFTHVHLFWVIGLLLALIELPDFISPLKRIAHAVEQLSGGERQGRVEELSSAGPPPQHSDPTG